MSTSRQRRDIGIEHLSIATRWAAVGAICLTGLFTAAAVRAFPGHSKHTGTPAGGASGGARGASQGSGSPASSNSLQPPSQPPTVSTSPPQVVSGGS